MHPPRAVTAADWCTWSARRRIKELTPGSEHRCIFVELGFTLAVAPVVLHCALRMQLDPSLIRSPLFQCRRLAPLHASSFQLLPTLVYWNADRSIRIYGLRAARGRAPPSSYTWNLFNAVAISKLTMILSDKAHVTPDRSVSSRYSVALSNEKTLSDVRPIFRRL